MSHRSEKPAYVIPVKELGLVIYQEKNQVGIQFVDPDGEVVFLPMPMRVLLELAAEVNDLAAKMPDVLQWSGGGS